MQIIKSKAVGFAALVFALALLAGSLAAQTINPNQIRPSATNGYTLQTLSGVVQWEPAGNCGVGNVDNFMVWFDPINSECAPDVYFADMQTAGGIQYTGNGASFEPANGAADYIFYSGQNGTAPASASVFTVGMQDTGTTANTANINFLTNTFGTGSGNVIVNANGNGASGSGEINLIGSNQISLDAPKLLLPGVLQGNCAFGLALDSTGNVVEDSCAGGSGGGGVLLQPGGPQQITFAGSPNQLALVNPAPGGSIADEFSLQTTDDNFTMYLNGDNASTDPADVFFDNYTGGMHFLAQGPITFNQTVTAPSFATTGAGQGGVAYTVANSTVTPPGGNYVGILAPPTGTPAYYLQLPAATPTGQCISYATPTTVNGVSQAVGSWVSCSGGGGGGGGGGGQGTGNLLSYSFDGGSPTSGLTATGSPALTTTNPYSSPNAVNFPSGQNYYTGSLSASSQTVYTGQRVLVNTQGTTSNSILQLYSGGNELFSLYLNSNNNTLNWSNIVAGTTGASGAPPLTVGTYAYVELYWLGNASTGAFAIRVNGSQVYTSTAIDTGANPVTAIEFGAPSAATSGWNVTMDNIDVGNVGWIDSTGGGGGGSGSGTVTTVSVASANGLQGTVTNASTTPSLSIGPDSSHYLPTTTDESNWNAKAPLASPALTGSPTAPTQTTGDNTTKIATDAFVLANAGSGGGMVYPGAGIGVSTGSGWGTSLTAPAGALVGTTDTQTLTNKTLDGVSPTTMGYLDATSSIQTQLNGKQASLGFTAVANTTTVNGHALSANVTVSASDVGLGSVTNAAQTLASIVPNTAPSAGNVPVGNSGGTAYAPVAISGDCTLAASGALTCTKSGGSSFGTAAFDAASAFDAAGAASTAQTNAEAYAANASNLASGTVAAGRLPAALASSSSVNGTSIPASVTLTQTIASGTAAMGTAAIASGACASVVTVAATGVLTTDNVAADFNGDPTSTLGYEPGAMLTIIKYPTAGDVNFKVCNNTAASITPGATTLNWRVTR